MTACAFCESPDSRHRIVDAAREHVKAGDSLESVLAFYGDALQQIADDYGLSLHTFLVEEIVMEAQTDDLREDLWNMLLPQPEQ